MNKTFGKLRTGKYLSFLAVLCLAFCYAANFRYYVNQSVYAAFDLRNLGEFGQKLHVSVLIAALAAIGWAAGLVTAYLSRKKKANAVTLYWLSGLFAIVALFFTPYNLQLLMPSTVMQNIATVACIAHFVFVAVDMWMFAWAFSVGYEDVCAQSGSCGEISVIITAIIAAVLAFVSMAYRWSFVLQTSVYGGALAALNVLHAAFPESRTQKTAKDVPEDARLKALAYTAVAVLLAAVMVCAYFVTEKEIAI